MNPFEKGPQRGPSAGPSSDRAVARADTVPVVDLGGTWRGELRLEVAKSFNDVRILKRLTFASERDRNVGVAILSEKELGTTRILLRPDLSWAYLGAQDKIVGPELKSVTDLGILLHEVGHAQQARDPKLRALVRTSDAFETSHTPRDVLREFDVLRGYWPRVATDECRADIVRMDEIYGELILQRAIARKLRGPVNDGHAFDAPVSSKAIIELQEERQALVARSSYEQLLQAPRRYLERDATARALRRIRELRSLVGVDFVRQVSSGVRSDEHGHLSGDARAMPENIVDMLRMGLVSHGADSPRLVGARRGESGVE